MTILVIVLPPEYRKDTGVQPPELSQFHETLSSKLTHAQLSDADWPSLIDAETLDGKPKLKINGKEHDLYSARINDKARALYVVRNQCVVIAGILWDHDYKHHPYLQGQTSEINVPNELLNAPTTDQVKADAAESTENDRVKLGRHPLTQKQEAIFQKAQRESVIVYAPAGAGKTELSVHLAKHNNQHGIETLYISPSHALSHHVRSALPEKDFRHIQISTTSQIETWINQRLGRSLLEDFNPERRATDFCFFAQWFEKIFCDRSSGYSQRKEEISRQNPREVYAHVINHIIKPNESIQDIARAYFAHIDERRPEYFEPHRRYHQIFRALQKLQPSELDTLKIAYLAVDEIQRIHPFVLFIVRFLLREGGLYFFCGDPYQDLSEYQLPLEEKFRLLQTGTVDPLLLDTSFRCSKSVGHFSNLLLALHQKIHGSTGGRRETFGFSVYDNAPMGAIQYLPNRRKKAVTADYEINPVPTFVLIPDDASLDEAKEQWKGMTVLHVSAAVGLEADHVILSGFGAAFSNSLKQLSKYTDTQLKEFIAETINFGRPYRHQEIPENIRQLRTALLTIYCGVTRAKLHVTLVDQDPHRELGRIISSVNEFLLPAKQLSAVTETSSPEAKTSTRRLTPEEWVDHTYSLITHDEQSTQAAGLAELKRSTIWGDHTALAEIWLDEQSLSNPDKLIAEIKIILRSENIPAELNKRIKNKSALDVSNMRKEYRALNLHEFDFVIDSGKKLQKILNVEKKLRSFIENYLQNKLMLADAAVSYANMAFKLLCVDPEKKYTPNRYEHYPIDFRSTSNTQFDGWHPSKWLAFLQQVHAPFTSDPNGLFASLVDSEHTAQLEDDTRLKQELLIVIPIIQLLRQCQENAYLTLLINTMFKIPIKKVLREAKNFHSVVTAYLIDLHIGHRWNEAFDLSEKLLAILEPEKIHSPTAREQLIRRIHFWSGYQIKKDNQLERGELLVRVMDDRNKPLDYITPIVLFYLLIKILCQSNELKTNFIIHYFMQLARYINQAKAHLVPASQDHINGIFFSEMKQMLAPTFLRCYEAHGLDVSTFSPAAIKEIIENLLVENENQRDQLWSAFIHKFTAFIEKATHAEILSDQRVIETLQGFTHALSSRQTKEVFDAFLSSFKKVMQAISARSYYETENLLIPEYAYWLLGGIEDRARTEEEKTLFEKNKGEFALVSYLSRWHADFIQPQSVDFLKKIDAEIHNILGANLVDLKSTEFVRIAESNIFKALKLRILLLHRKKLNKQDKHTDHDRLIACVNDIIKRKHQLSLNEAACATAAASRGPSSAGAQSSLFSTLSALPAVSIQHDKTTDFPSSCRPG